MLTCPWFMSYQFTKTAQCFRTRLDSWVIFFFIVSLANWQDLHFLEGKAIFSVFRAQLREKQHQSSGGRDIKLIMTLGKMRGHSVGRHMEKGDDEKLRWFLWSSTAKTQICTFVVIHSGACHNPGHGSGHFQNKGFQFTHITCSPLHYISPSRSLQCSHTSPPPLFSSSVSTLISLLHYLPFISPEIHLGERRVMLCMKAAFTWLAQLE